MNYVAEYTCPGREHAERALRRYRGVYNGCMHGNVKINGPKLRLSEDAVSHLEKICLESGIRFRQKNLKPINK